MYYMFEHFFQCEIEPLSYLSGGALSLYRAWHHPVLSPTFIVWTYMKISYMPLQSLLWFAHIYHGMCHSRQRGPKQQTTTQASRLNCVAFDLVPAGGRS